MPPLAAGPGSAERVPRVAARRPTDGSAGCLPFTAPSRLASRALVALLLFSACATPRPMLPVGPTETMTPEAAEPSRPFASPPPQPPPAPEAVPGPAVAAPVPLPPQEPAASLLGELLEEGLVSFYSDALAGRPTASGEPYDPAVATCAHRTLPFGTELLIEVPSDGGTAYCRVNDRGPFVAGRVLDVSRVVAEQLRMTQAGVIEARLHRARPGAAAIPVDTLVP